MGMGKKTFVVRKLGKRNTYSTEENVDGDLVMSEKDMRDYLRNKYGSGKFNILLAEKGKQGLRNYGTYVIDGDEATEELTEPKESEKASKKKVEGVKKPMVDYAKVNAIINHNNMIERMEYIIDNEHDTFTAGELRILREELNKANGFLTGKTYWQEFCIRIHYNENVINNLIVNGDTLTLDLENINLGDW